MMLLGRLVVEEDEDVDGDDYEEEELRPMNLSKHSSDRRQVGNIS